jgi:hypothetical protein
MRVAAPFGVLYRKKRQHNQPVHSSQRAVERWDARGEEVPVGARRETHAQDGPGYGSACNQASRPGRWSR